VRLISLRLEQWRSFERCELDFPDGLIGVVGPNGAGKTTLAEAVGWALFGRLRPGAKVGDVRRQGADSRSLVELVFRLDDTVYRVERVVGGAAKLWIGDDGEPETVAVRATNARLVRELDMTWEIFQRTVFARQKDVAALDPAGTADTRRRHVERLLGLERYRDAAERARTSVKHLDAELGGLRDAAPDLVSLRTEVTAASEAASASDPAVLAAEAVLETAKAALDNVERALEQSRLTAVHHAALMARRDRAAETAENCDDRLAACRRQATARATKLEQLAELHARRDDVGALAAVRRGWDDAQVRHTALAAAEAAEAMVAFDPEATGRRAARLSAVRAELDEIHASPAVSTEGLEQRVEALELAEAAGCVADAQAALDAAEALRDALRERIAVLHEDVARDSEHLDAIERSGPDAPCTVCLRPYGEDFDEIRRAQGERLEAHTGALAAHRRQLCDSEGEWKLATTTLRAAETAAAAIARTAGADSAQAAREALVSARAAAAERAARLADLDARRRELEPAVAADGHAERAAAEHRGRLAECRAQLAATLARLGVARYDGAAHAIALACHDDAIAARELALKLRSEVEASAGIDDEVTSLEAELAAATGERTGAETELRTLSFDAELEPLLRGRRDTATQAKETAIESLGAARAEARARDAHVRELTTRLEHAEGVRVRIAEHERTLREHAAAAAILTDFRTAQNERAWPRLEEGAGALLGETTDGRYLDVRLSQDYKLVMVDRGEEHGLERYSGGEQDLANLCLRLAIADWVARERGVEIGFVVLDEVFGSQDDERRRRLVDELRGLSNRFHQLLVITHASDVADLCEHQIVVGLDGPGRSTAEIIAGAGAPHDAAIA
jgi:exonuclease SbcC